MGIRRQLSHPDLSISVTLFQLEFRFIMDADCYN
jgi:hypothetical protein